MYSSSQESPFFFNARISFLNFRIMNSGNIKIALESIWGKITVAAARCPSELCTGEAHLVAVTKTKPKEDVIQAYSYGQRAFGENYVQELVEKASDQEVLEKCPDIRWHFIGHLQSNKVKQLLGAPNLWLVETVHSAKIASSLNQALMQREQRLKVMVQVNTSAEGSKSGVDPSSVMDVVDHIITKCSKLELVGLMTIGLVEGGIQDFKTMQNCRRQVLDRFPHLERLQLSMGMSGDFEQAIEMGSTSVRIGTAIFGSRHYAPS